MKRKPAPHILEAGALDNDSCCITAMSLLTDEIRLPTGMRIGGFKRGWLEMKKRNASYKAREAFCPFMLAMLFLPASQIGIDAVRIPVIGSFPTLALLSTIAAAGLAVAPSASIIKRRRQSR